MEIIFQRAIKVQPQQFNSNSQKQKLVFPSIKKKKKAQSERIVCWGWHICQDGLSCYPFETQWVEEEMTWTAVADTKVIEDIL